MTSQVVDRRRFLQFVAIVGVLPTICDGTREQNGAQLPYLTLYDGRFASARERAWRLAAGGPTRNVNGDPTDIALLLTSPGRRGQTLALRGITVESLPFCLAHQSPRSKLLIERVDRDLFIWEFSNA